MKAAVAAAFTSPGTGGSTGHNFRHGAAIFDGARLKITAVNSYKQSTRLIPYTPWPNLHAESCAILRLGYDECAGNTLYVCRILKNGSLTESRPCKVCQRLISLSGLRNVYYTNRLGEIEKLELA